MHSLCRSYSLGEFPLGAQFFHDYEKVEIVMKFRLFLGIARELPGSFYGVLGVFLRVLQCVGMYLTTRKGIYEDYKFRDFSCI